MAVDMVPEIWDRRKIRLPQIPQLPLWAAIEMGPLGGQKETTGFTPLQGPGTLRTSVFWGAPHHAGHVHPHSTLCSAANLQARALSVSMQSFWLRFYHDEINHSVAREPMRFVLGAPHCFWYNEWNSLAYAFPYLVLGLPNAAKA